MGEQGTWRLNFKKVRKMRENDVEGKNRRQKEVHRRGEETEARMGKGGREAWTRQGIERKKRQRRINEGDGVKRD